MLPQDLARDRAVVDRPSLRRSVDLFRAFRVEQTDPDRFYGALASDSISQLRRARLHGRVGETLVSLRGSDLDPHLAMLAHHFAQAAPVERPDRAIGRASCRERVYSNV